MATFRTAIVLFGLLFPGYAAAAAAGTVHDACGYAYKKLKAVPSERLSWKAAEFAHDGTRFQGCEVTLTGDITRLASDQFPRPLFYPYENSPRYLAGWRADEEADGPDGTSFRISNGRLFCFVQGNWDGGDDDDPKYVPSKRIVVTVQCGDLGG